MDPKLYLLRSNKDNNLGKKYLITMENAAPHQQKTIV